MNICNKCKKEIKKKVYRINICYRDPYKVYGKSKVPFMQTENYLYCRKHFLEVRKLINKIV